MIQKSYENDKASCYIVPTPIGNMKDMTERGKEVLEMVDAIFCRRYKSYTSFVKSFGN